MKKPKKQPKGTLVSKKPVKPKETQYKPLYASAAEEHRALLESEASSDWEEAMQDYWYDLLID